ncbi:Heme peroxidase [Variovorax sp. LjRoot84]|uniref:Heme peroxidase n=1 Tax=Variovorax sp. LjRoot84 TaxID=3342340 RepID=UPI003ECC9252
MDKHYDLPGSPAWHARRARCFNAGDAPAMLNCSPLKTRTELLHEIHTGIAREFSDYVQERVIDPGHVVEAKARPIAEEILDEELQVIAGSLPVDGLSRPLGASLDGTTFMEDGNWECKSLNEELRAALPHAGRDSHERNDGKALPKDKRVQMEQQMLVNGAKRTLFTAARLDENGEIAEERHAWYYPDAALRAEIIPGWRQFDADLATYVAPPAAAPAVVGRTPETLPALRIEVTGEVTDSNLEQYREHALAVFAGINRDLKTDQDFANAAKTVQWCGDVESRLKAAKEHALSQTESIDKLFKTIDAITDEARATRLELNKLVEARKIARKGEIVAGGVKGLADHIAALNTRLGKPYMPAIPADFGGAVKSLRTFESMQNAVDSALATAKIAASAAADRIQTNLTTLRELALAHVMLFPDTAQIVLKAPDDLTTLVKARIAEHTEKERLKEEQQRERIRNEERERLEREQRKAQEAEDALVASFQANANRIEFDSVPYIQKAIAAFESGAKDFDNDPRPRVVAALTAAREQMSARLEAAKAREQAAAPAPAPAAAAPQPIAAAPAPTVIAMQPRAAAVPTSKPTLSLGQIKERIAPIQITADGLATLGFNGLKDRGSVLFHESEYPHILAALVAHVQAIQAKQAA